MTAAKLYPTTVYLSADGKQSLFNVNWLEPTPLNDILYYYIDFVIAISIPDADMKFTNGTPGIDYISIDLYRVFNHDDPNIQNFQRTGGTVSLFGLVALDKDGKPPTVPFNVYWRVNYQSLADRIWYPSAIGVFSPVLVPQVASSGSAKTQLSSDGKHSQFQLTWSPPKGGNIVNYFLDFVIATSMSDANAQFTTGSPNVDYISIALPLGPPTPNFPWDGSWAEAFDKSGNPPEGKFTVYWRITCQFSGNPNWYISDIWTFIPKTIIVPIQSAGLNGIDIIARIAWHTWNDRQAAIVMTAIAGAESGYNINPWGPCAADATHCIVGPGQTHPSNQIGAWQIGMGNNQHWNQLVAIVGTSDLTSIVNWLLEPANNALMAKMISPDGRVSLTAWSVYSDGSYLSNMPAATAAVDRAMQTGTLAVQIVEKFVSQGSPLVVDMTVDYQGSSANLRIELWAISNVSNKVYIRRTSAPLAGTQKFPVHIEQPIGGMELGYYDAIINVIDIDRGMSIWNGLPERNVWVLKP